MAEDKDIYGGLDPEKLADQAALAEAEKHHVEVTKPEGFADNEFAVRYTDDKDQEQDIVATRNPDRAGKDDEFDFWAPHKDPNTGKYTVKADIGNDILTLGINLYARKFYAKWYAEQKQAEAARQQGNPEQAVAGLEKEAEKWARENAELKNQLGQQEQKRAPEPQPEVQNQAPQVGAVPGQRSSVDERLDRIERNQQIMMEKLNRIEENQRSFFDKLMQRVGNGLEMLGSGLEKLGNMLDRTGDNLLITSGRIQAGFDRLTGQENFAEYPSRPQAPQQGAGNGDDALHKKIAELEAEIKKLREENTRLKEQLEQQKQQSKNPETRNEDKAPELADPAETAAMEKTSGKQEQKRAEAKTETRNEDKAPEPASDEEKLQNKAPELADPAETAAVEKKTEQQEQKQAPEPQPEVQNQAPQQAPEARQTEAATRTGETKKTESRQAKTEAPKSGPSKPKKKQHAADSVDSDDPGKRYVLNPISGKKIPLADRALKNLDPSVVSRINEGKFFRSADLAVAISYARLKTNSKPLSVDNFRKQVADAGFIADYCISKDAVAIPCDVRKGGKNVDFYFSTKDIDFQKLQERVNPEAVQYLKTMLEGAKDINALTAERKSVKADMKEYLRQQKVTGKDATARLKSIYELGAKSINTFFRSIEKNPSEQYKNNRLTIGKDSAFVPLDEARKAEQKLQQKAAKQKSGGRTL